MAAYDDDDGEEEEDVVIADDDDGEEEEDVVIGDIAEQYLRKFAAARLVQIRRLDCGIMMVSFTLGTI